MRISTLIFAAGVALIAFSTVGCKKKGCTNQYADNYSSVAKKDDGSCTLSREKFLGTYAVSQTCTIGSAQVYNMTITSGAADNEVIISNFRNFGLTITGVIEGNEIFIDDIDNGWSVVGSGYIANNEMLLDFDLCNTNYNPCLGETCGLVAYK